MRNPVWSMRFPSVVLGVPLLLTFMAACNSGEQRTSPLPRGPQVPTEFIGKWIASANGDRLTITANSVVWHRTDSRNKGKHRVMYTVSDDRSRIAFSMDEPIGDGLTIQDGTSVSMTCKGDSLSFFVFTKGMQPLGSVPGPGYITIGNKTRTFTRVRG